MKSAQNNETLKLCAYHSNHQIRTHLKAISIDDEIRELRRKLRSSEAQAQQLQERVDKLETDVQEHAAAFEIGKEVRLRYLENYRRRTLVGTGRGIGSLAFQRIKSGDRAAHRGRPVVDSWLCISGEFPHEAVFRDLYGLTAEGVEAWAEVSEMIAATGFRGSLQSEGWLTPVFQETFQKLVDLALPYPSPIRLKEAFVTNRKLASTFQDLQDCYDHIISIRRQSTPNIK